MPRPMKARRVCCIPENRMFVPEHEGEQKTEPIILTVDEYEAFRLMDFEGMSQEECSQSMEVARTTVQKIYSDARKKIAEALVLSKPIKIEGGDFRLYSENERLTSPGGCYRHRRGGCGRGGRE